MKPLKSRIQIYIWIAVAGLLATFCLLVTGYDYTKAQGFFIATDRDAMSFGEALGPLLNEYIWFLAALLLIILIVEAIVFAFILYKKKTSVNE